MTDDMDWPAPAVEPPADAPVVDEQPTGPTRLERVREVLRLEGLAAAARARAAAHREALQAEACAELARGIAPTWRIADVGTITLPTTSAGVTVTDPAALLAWVAERHPTEVETTTTRQIRAAFQGALLRRVLVDDGLGLVVDPDVGEVVPGLTWRAGGEAKTLSFRIEPDVRALFAAAADEQLGAER